MTTMPHARLRPLVLLVALLAPVTDPAVRAAAEDTPGGACPAGAIRTPQGCVTNPQLLHRVPPDYPPLARRERVTGTVTLQAVVTPSGSVTDITVLDATSTNEDHLESLKQSAQEALAQWRYKPGTRDGKPIPVVFTTKVTFELDPEKVNPPEAGAPSADEMDSFYARMASLAGSDELKPLFAKLLKLAQTGNTEAQYNVGMMYNNGMGVARDPQQAYTWFTRAAAAGEPLAAYKVGCYLAGQWKGVVPEDPAGAFDQKLVAARAGYVLAQREVGFYFAGRSDPENALKWLKEAAGQGDGQALAFVGAAYAYPGKAGDPVLAYAYLTLAKTALGGGLPPKYQGFLDRVTGELPPAGLAEAERFVSGWHARPTPLTLRAFEGLEPTAERLVKAAGG